MATLNIPNSFSNGSTADATEMNANFNAVKSFVETNLVQVDGSVKTTNASLGVLVNVVPKTGDYQLASGDENTTLLLNKTSPATFILSVPDDGTYNFPTGTQISFIQTGTAQVEFQPLGGVTINSDGGKKKILVQYGAASLIKTAANTWVLIGQLTA